jgi:hypothetical protein
MMTERPKRQTTFDEATADILQDFVQRREQQAASQQEAAEATRPGKKKHKKGRDRSWDANRTKVTLDLTEEQIEQMRDIQAELAEEFGAGVTFKEVSRLVVDAGIRAYQAGELEIRPKTAKVELQLK